MHRRTPAILTLALAVLLACTPQAIPTPTPSPTPALATPTRQPVASPTPTATPTPTPTVSPPIASPTPSPTTAPARPASSAPPERDMYDLAARLALKDGRPIPRVVNPKPVSYAQGREDTFQVADIPNRRVYSVAATLQLVTEHAYWYVDDAERFPRPDMEKAAKLFEEVIYPRITNLFGPELSPGIDNDVHLTILHTPLNGVAGYFSTADEYPLQVHPYSNQREMIYLDIAGLPLGSVAYLGTLAHEFTHAVQFRADPTEEGWLNEGLAEFGKRLAGYTPSFQGAFFAAQPVSLTAWPLDLGSTAPHYGAASLFTDYLAQQFGAASLRTLLEEPANGLASVTRYLEAEGDGRTFREVFADWLVANYLDDSRGGVYSYPDSFIVGFQPLPLGGPTNVEDMAPQYAARYYSLPVNIPGLRVVFQGQPQTPLLPQQPPIGERCWWGNQGDSIDATLTGRFDLPPGKTLTLDYSLWYEIEQGWDFAYVEVSTDAGRTWDILEGKHTVRVDSLRNAFGPAYTGASGGWLRERIDLSPYAGNSILLRFEYVTDDAIHGAGLCLDDIALLGAGFSDDAESDAQAWEAQGFLRAPYQVEQEYLLRLIEVNAAGATVTAIPVGSDGAATFTLDAPAAGVDVAVLVVAPMNDRTLLPASFTLELLTP
ncbi:MAG: immune inhibitor A [Chloroflexi bacterium]|nr:immune inhibitor A [Chloroflexota bacterium]